MPTHSPSQTPLITQNHYQIYTDGGYFEKLNIGGWGFVIFKNDQEIYRDSYWQKDTSSLEMELIAANNALTDLQKLISRKERYAVTLYSDSRILIDGLTEKYPIWCQNQWRVKSGKTVVYKELWQSLFHLREQQQASLCWVKSHNGNHGNSLADTLAREAVLNRIA